MVTADFRPEAEFTQFLRMRTKEIDKSLCILIEELFPYYRKLTSSERMAGSDFNGKLVNSRLRACAVKICQNPLIMLSNRHNVSAFIKKSGSLNTMVP